MPKNSDTFFLCFLRLYYKLKLQGKVRFFRNSLQWNLRYSTKKQSGDGMNFVLINKYYFCINVVKGFEIFSYLTLQVASNKIDWETSIPD